RYYSFCLTSVTLSPSLLCVSLYLDHLALHSCPTRRSSDLYGGEYVLVGLGASASAVRPRAQLSYRVTQGWSTELVLASMPTSPQDRKSTRLNSSHQIISYAVFCFINKNWEGCPCD